MTFIYPAVFKKTPEGSFQGYFPDLSHCTALGNTLEEAVLAAHDAAFNWITLELSEEKPDMPLISQPADLHLERGEVLRNICVHIRLLEGWEE